jgi:hypothetical protein
MHDCQRFREDWITGSVGDPAGCGDCRQFCDEAGAVLVAFDTSRPGMPDNEYWLGFDNRLRTRLIRENAVTRQRAVRTRWIVAFASAASVVLAVTWGSFYTSPVESTRVAVRFENAHIEGLDPRLVTFLGQSELDLRNFTKIEPSYTEEIREARDRASRSLERIAAQKSAAADFAPVRIVLDEYESVLREIKNLDSPEQISDIQMRIRRNGLIANLKAYQPRVVLASSR